VNVGWADGHVTRESRAPAYVYATGSNLLRFLDGYDLTQWSTPYTFSDIRQISPGNYQYLPPAGYQINPNLHGTTGNRPAQWPNPNNVMRYHNDIQTYGGGRAILSCGSSPITFTMANIPKSIWNPATKTTDSWAFTVNWRYKNLVKRLASYTDGRWVGQDPIIGIEIRDINNNRIATINLVSKPCAGPVANLATVDTSLDVVANDQTVNSQPDQVIGTTAFAGWANGCCGEVGPLWWFLKSTGRWGNPPTGYPMWSDTGMMQVVGTDTGVMCVLQHPAVNSGQALVYMGGVQDSAAKSLSPAKVELWDPNNEDWIGGVAPSGTANGTSFGTGAMGYFIDPTFSYN